jgi:hypothetical protein
MNQTTAETKPRGRARLASFVRKRPTPADGTDGAGRQAGARERASGGRIVSIGRGFTRRYPCGDFSLACVTGIWISIKIRT